MSIRRLAFPAAVLLLPLLAVPTRAGVRSHPNPCAHPTIVGTNGQDHIRGTGGNDIIDAKGGNDEVHARYGDDIICGGTGDDYILGSRGNDRIYGGPGNDKLYGAAGIDIVLGQQGTDEVHGGPGDDTLLKGGPGYYDKILGEGGNDHCLDARDGGTYDHIDGGPGYDTWAGDSGDGDATAVEHRVASCP